MGRDGFVGGREVKNGRVYSEGVKEGGGEWLGVWKREAKRRGDHGGKQRQLSSFFPYVLGGNKGRIMQYG